MALPETMDKIRGGMDVKIRLQNSVICLGTKFKQKIFALRGDFAIQWKRTHKEGTMEE